MKIAGFFKRHGTLLAIPLWLLSGCAGKKETAASRGMQNLTARYNILYNANEQFKTASAAVLDAAAEDYSRLLTVYKEPVAAAGPGASKALDSVLARTNVIIGEKSQSRYVDDAWMLAGKVNYVKNSFFNAAEYFHYVYTTYYDEGLLRQQALFWKARSLMRIKDLENAAVALDSALKHPVGGKRDISDVYAAEAQFNIYSGNEENAIEMLKKALKTGSSRQNVIRWSYVLAQLEEKNGHPEEAWNYYTSVMKSNAPFEMAFNANLNRMRLKTTDNSTEARTAALKSLLRQGKNKDFLDQIYFRIAGIYLENGQKELALQNYRLGLKASTFNRNQQGLIYLQLAEISFKDADYVKAKAYYDSTLSALPPEFPGYENIRLKSSNLDFLAQRLKEISREDTLQMLAKLPEGEMDSRAGAIVREQQKRLGAIAQQPGPFTAAIDAGDRNNVGTGKFYFNNTLAIGQGLNDFKKRWGNRKLEDNWRRSGKAGIDLQTANASILTSTDASSPGGLSSAGELMVKEMIRDVPLTPAQMKTSDEKIINAYYEIAGFYKDELRDNAEAIKAYQQLLSRFPGNSYAPSVYYNLYRIYSGSDQAKAAQYRAMLLKEFPGSVYAGVLQDPDYAKKADQRTVALNAAYATAYTAYSSKDYQGVRTAFLSTGQKFGAAGLSPQFAYLNALAIGHLQRADSLETSLKSLVDQYPADKTITPLAKKQLEFIRQNREMLNTREIALSSADAGFLVEAEPPTAVPPVTAGAAEQVEQTQPTAGKQQEMAAAPSPAPVARAPAAGQPAASQPVNAAPVTAAAPAPLYELPAEATYYFVINVSDIRLNLNPSRFELGQFIRSNFASAGIRHESREVNNENQLVSVGKFASLQAVRAYESRILPLMKQIMKIPAEKYNTFVITEKELNKLTDRPAISRYSEFYSHVH